MNVLHSVAAVALVAFASCGAAQAPGTDVQKTRISLGTATPGGGFPLYGDTVAEIVNRTDPSLLLETRNTKGSTENSDLLTFHGVLEFTPWCDFGCGRACPESPLAVNCNSAG